MTEVDSAPRHPIMESVVPYAGVPGPEYYSGVKEEILDFLGSMGIDPSDVLFSGYSRSQTKPIDDESFIIHFNGVDGLDYVLPDVIHNGPITFALRGPDGAIDIYDRSALEELGIDRGVFSDDVWWLVGMEKALQAKIAEFHLLET